MTDLSGNWISWNGRIKHSYRQLYQPRNEAELAAIVAGSPSIRVVGTGRSSADICAGTTDLIDFTRYSTEIRIDLETMTVTASPGVMLADLIQALARQGFCLATLPDIDCISLGGAIATGTHGTGQAGLSLSDYLCAARLVLPDGTIRSLDQSSRDLPLDAVRVSLGVLGVFSELTLRIEPLFQLAVTERPCRDQEWLAAWPDLLDRHDFLRLLWLPHTGWATLITGDKFSGQAPFQPKAAPQFHEHRRAVSSLLYAGCARLPGLTPLANKLLKSLFFSATVRKTGSLYDATVTKSRGSTLELAEWTIPFSRFSACFTALRGAMARGDAYGHIPMDIRFIRKSSGWLANSHEADTVTVGCVSRTPRQADRHRIFAVIEAIFLEHGGRPHWAKRFTADATSLDRLYPRLPEFRNLRRGIDPHGKFLNAWLASRFA